MATRKEIKENVKFLFLNENFKELDLIADKYRDSAERTGSGIWKLTSFYYGFNGLTGSSVKEEGYWLSIKEKSDNWIKENPKSSTAHIVKGIILKGYAWKFRGDSWSKNVPSEAWKPFEDNLLVAHAYMLKSKDIASKDPHWYVTTAHIKNGLNVDNEIFMQFIEEGLDKHPNYYQLYFSAVNYLAPKWHGDKEKIESFANQAVTRTMSNQGFGMYARIYWYASQTQYDDRLFSESNIVWPKMKKGIYDVIKKYPDQWNIQNFAFFACIANDMETTRSLFDQMHSLMIIRAWKRQDYYDYCKSFAYTEKGPNTRVN